MTGREPRGGSPASPSCQVRVERRLLLVVQSLGIGGAERQMALLAKSLPSEWVIRVASLEGGLWLDELLDAEIEVDVLSRAFRLDVRPMLAVGRIIREWRPSIVQTWGWMPTSASLVACRLARVPVIGSIRCGRVEPYRGRVERLMNACVDAVIANSQAGLDAFGVDPRRGYVVHNGFDPDRWALCPSTRPAGSPFTVVMTGWMGRNKDYRCLLDAARVLSAEDPGGWRFLAVGQGPERDSLLHDYRDLVDSGVAVFPGNRSEVLDLVSDANVGVLLTDPAHAAEGLSNSIMEYMACGLPVVCTDSGGNRELVIEGVTGVLTPPSDSEALIAALRSLRGDPQAAASLGRAGRERIATHFTVDRMVRETLAVYESVTGRKRH